MSEPTDIILKIYYRKFMLNRDFKLDVSKPDKTFEDLSDEEKRVFAFLWLLLNEILLLLYKEGEQERIKEMIKSELN